MPSDPHGICKIICSRTPCQAEHWKNVQYARRVIHRGPPEAALTIAKIPARITSGSPGQAATTASLNRPFVEFVYITPRRQVGFHHLDHPALAFIRQPIPQSHDQSKIRVFDVGCGQGVGKRFLMCARIVVSRWYESAPVGFEPTTFGFESDKGRPHPVLR